jgi:hypothetical protein
MVTPPVPAPPGRIALSETVASDDPVKALRVEGAMVSPTNAVPGATVRVSFRVVNHSDEALAVPKDPTAGLYLAGRAIESIELESDPGPIGARTPVPPTTQSLHPDDRGLDVVAALGQTIWPVGASIAYTTTISTRGYATGTYRYTIGLHPVSGGAAVTSVVIEFGLKAVSAEWSAAIGAAATYGRATLRAYSTGDGSLAVLLRALLPRRTYTLSVVRGTCVAPIAAIRIGAMTTGATGRASRTITLSPTTTSAIRASGRVGPLLLRVASGSSRRCGRLASVPLYGSALHWDAFPLETLPPPHSTGVPTSGSSIVTFESKLFVGGERLKPDGLSWSSIVWSSSDATSWTSTTLDGSNSVLLGTDGRRLVAVAKGAAWWSADGMTWTRASTPPVASGDQTYRGVSVVTGLPGGGFLAFLFAGAIRTDAQAWMSRDGDVWRPLADSTALVDFGATSVIASGSRIVAVGRSCGRGDDVGCTEPSGVVVVSSDGGRTWTRNALAGRSGISGVRAATAGFMAWRAGEVWLSPDALTWRKAGQLPLRPGYDVTFVSAIAPFGAGEVAVGSSAWGADVSRGEVLVSGDGLTWRFAPDPPGMGDAALRDAVVWNGRLVVLGENGREFVGESNRAVVWVARVLPDP